MASASRPGADHRQSRVLVVDDNADNRDMLMRRLQRQGLHVQEAESGQKGLEMLRSRPFDLVLLDVAMPDMDGFEMLKIAKADAALKDIPVIMVSALDEIENAVRCIELGAEDYLTKPFDSVLLAARIGACLDRKRLRDQERNHFAQIQLERQKAETLLDNLLPLSISKRLKDGESAIADQFACASVLCAEIADFSQVTAKMSPAETVALLSDIFSQFDWLADLHGLEKIKTNVGAYIAAAGLPIPQPNHVSAAIELALEMQKVVGRFSSTKKLQIELCIGVASGPVIGGVIGRKKLIYDIWGDAVQHATVLQNACKPGCILVNEAACQQLADKYLLTPARPASLETGKIKTYTVTRRGSQGQ
jgi:DNA-binding response OmpR family regulator